MPLTKNNLMKGLKVWKFILNKTQTVFRSSWMCDTVLLGKCFTTFCRSMVPASSRVKLAMKKIPIGLLDQIVHCHIPGD
jgi:hypothetical protein